MADGTKIEWSDATANFLNGCSVVSPGCTNCYAMRLAGTRMRDHPTRAGLTQPTKAGPVWTGEIRPHWPALAQVLSWARPRMIFWNAHGDLFHDNVPEELIDANIAAIALTPQHKHQLLTKRSARMRAYFDGLDREGGVGRVARFARAMGTIYKATGHVRCHPKVGVPFVPHPLPNLWLGVSAEDQTRAVERIPDLLRTSAAVRWVSAEPLLGALDLRGLALPDDPAFDCTNIRLDALTGYHRGVPKLSGVAGPSLPPRLPGLDWVVAGGESGPGSRPMHPEWERQLRQQCEAAFVPYLAKQWGDWSPERRPGAESIAFRPDGSRYVPTEPDGYLEPTMATMYRIGKGNAGRVFDGQKHDGYPA